MKKEEITSLSKTKLKEYLLAHPTVADSTWTEEKREKGEKREDFIKRVLGRKSSTPKIEDDGPEEQQDDDEGPENLQEQRENESLQELLP